LQCIFVILPLPQAFLQYFHCHAHFYEHAHLHKTFIAMNILTSPPCHEHLCKTSSIIVSFIMNIFIDVEMFTKMRQTSPTITIQ
jgi:hypothetical protein